MAKIQVKNPIVEIDGDEIVYKNYYHIGVAVGTDRGLVVPVVREADRMSLAEIETQITDYGKRARDGKLGIEDHLRITLEGQPPRQCLKHESPDAVPVRRLGERIA